MADWMIWFVLAGVLVILEMFTGTFYLLMIAIGFSAGGVIALVGPGRELQLLAAALVGAVATYGLRRSGLGRFARRDAARNPDVNLDIGQTLMVDAWLTPENGAPTARAIYRGASWDIELEAGTDPRPGLFVIREVQGSRLIVANAGSPHH